jgi:hypothetical protein
MKSPKAPLKRLQYMKQDDLMPKIILVFGLFIISDCGVKPIQSKRYLSRGAYRNSMMHG